MSETETPKGILTGVPQILFYPALMKQFGFAGALIIQQVHYWCATNRENNEPERAGHHWMFMSVSQWVERLEVIGRTKVVTTIAELEQAGILIAASFNKHTYDRTKWYRIDYSKLVSALNEGSETIDFLVSYSGNLGQSIKAKTPDKSDLPTYGICHATAYPMSPGGIPYATPRHDNTKKNLKKKEKNKHDVQSHVPETSTRKKIVIGKNRTATTSADILKQFKANKEGPTPEKVSPTNMELLWKKRVSQLEGVSFVKSFTAMQRGQCKHYINAVGEARAFPVLEHALGNWIGFTKYVESNAGVKKTPMLPDLGFLLKHAEHAVNYAAPHLNKGEPAKSAPKMTFMPGKKIVLNKNTKTTPLPEPVQLIAPTQPTPTQTAEDEDELVDLDFLSKWKNGGV